MLAISGEYVWNVRSTPSPLEILRTTKDEFSPRLRFPITTPSYACTRLRSPSTTLTLTTIVSPGANSGIVLPKRAISSCSSCEMMFILRCSMIKVNWPLACAQRRSPPDAHAFHKLLLLVLVPRYLLALELLEQLGFLLAHTARRQQFRPPQPGSSQRLLAPPTRDARMIARQQHCWNRNACIHLWPRVVRTV